MWISLMNIRFMGSFNESIFSLSIAPYIIAKRLKRKPPNIEIAAIRLVIWSFRVMELDVKIIPITNGKK